MPLTVWKGACMGWVGCWSEFCPPRCDACANTAEKNNNQGENDNVDVVLVFPNLNE